MTDEAKALAEWLDKTKWVQESVQPHELGLHRADVLRNRAETQAREIKRLREAVALKDQYFKGITKLAALGETSAALAGDSHD